MMDDDLVNVGQGLCVTHVFHLLLGGAKASILPFLTVFFRQLGLTATQVGIVFAIKAFLWMWSSPLWTACAKCCGKKKIVLSFSLLMLLISILALSFVPPVNVDLPQEFCERYNGSGIHYMPNLGHHPSFNVEDASNMSETSSNFTAVNPENNKSIEEGDITSENSKSKEEGNITPNISKSKEKGDIAVDITTTVAPDIEKTNSGEKEKQEDSYLDMFGDDSSSDYNGMYTDFEKLLEDMSQEDLAAIQDNPKFHDMLKNYQIGNNKPSQNRKSKKGGHSGRTHRREKRSDEKNGVQGMLEKWHGQMFPGKDKNYATMAAIVILIVIGELISSPVDKMADDCWFEYLDITDALERYGHHRAWKTFGAMIVGPLSALAVAYTPCMLSKHIPNILIHFFIFSGCCALAFLVSFGYPVSQKKSTPKRARLDKGLRLLCGDMHAFSYSSTLVLVGASYAAIWNVLFWQLQDLGGGHLEMGLMVGVAALSDLLVFPLRHSIIKHITHAGTVLLALVMLAGRMLMYSFAWHPVILVAGEGLHGFSGILLWTALTTYPDFRLNPFVMDRGAHAFAGALWGFGLGCGSLLSGFTYDHVGFELLFQATSILLSCWCAFFLFVQRFLRKKEKIRYAKLLQDEDDSNDEDTVFNGDWLEVAMSKDGVRNKKHLT